MTYFKHPITYEDIEHTPACVLLKLSQKKLNSLIQEAEERADKAQIAVIWLKGLKMEKTLRENPDMEDLGGAE